MLARGGAGMKGPGVEPLADLDGLAVMGPAEVLPRLPFLYRLRRRLISLLDTGVVDLVIPVDFAGFNLRIARAARRRGLPVLYYIAPKVWAWGARRIKQLAAYTNQLALILPFEAEPLVRAGANATFVGHPLLETPAAEPDRSAFCRRLSLAAQRPVFALLPDPSPPELGRPPPPSGGGKPLPDLAIPLIWPVGWVVAPSPAYFSAPLSRAAAPSLSA